MRPIRISASNNYSNSQVKGTQGSSEDKFLILRMFMAVETERLNSLVIQKSKEIENLQRENAKYSSLVIKFE